MNRRDLMTYAVVAASWPAAAPAQQKAMPVIGYLGTSSELGMIPSLAAFRAGLSEAGYVEGRSVAIEFRWVEGHYDRLPALAAELVARKVDVIVTTAPLGSLRRKAPPRRSRLSSTAATTWSRPAWSLVSLARAGISPVSVFSAKNLTPSGSKW